jgi:hypothetical protein
MPCVNKIAKNSKEQVSISNLGRQLEASSHFSDASHSRVWLLCISQPALGEIISASVLLYVYRGHLHCITYCSVHVNYFD